MAITQAFANSFKTELFTATHDFTNSTGHVFKLALYTSSATLSKSTTAYSATNEASGTGYSAGGATATQVTPTLSGDTALVDFGDVTWASSSISAAGALLYNSSASNAAVVVLDFGTTITTSSQTFTVTMPAATSSQAIVRLT